MGDADERPDGQDELVTDESVLVGATAEQPAAEAFVEAGRATAPTAPVRQPWEYRQPDTAQERMQDAMTLLAKIAEGGISRNNLRDAVALPEERFRNAFSVVQLAPSAVDDPQTGGLMLTTIGRSYLESSRPRPAAPPVTVDLETAFDRYRVAGDEAWPAWRDEQRRVLHEAEIERNWQATQAWGTVLGYFRTLPTFDQEWARITEPDLRAPNLLALRPRFPLPNGVELHLRLTTTRGYDGVTLQASTGGNGVWLAAHSEPREIEQALGLCLRFGLEAAAARIAQPNPNGDA